MSAADAQPESIGSRDLEIYTWNGTPEGAIKASPGALCLNKDGGANTTLYVKETGTGNTGWVAK